MMERRNRYYVPGIGTTRGVEVVLTAGHCVYDQNDGWSYRFSCLDSALPKEVQK